MIGRSTNRLCAPRRFVLCASILVVGLALASSNALAAGTAKPAWRVFELVGPTHLYSTTGERDEVQTVSVLAGSEVDFSLTFDGQTTGSIACAAAPSAVQQELEALPDVGAGNVRVEAAQETESRFCARYLVSFDGALGNEAQPRLGGTPNTEIEITKPGRGGWGKLSIFLVNEGGAPTSGPVTVTVTLPPGLSTYETPEGTTPQVSETVGGPEEWGWSCTKGVGLRTIACTQEQPAYPGLGPGKLRGGTPADSEPLLIPLRVGASTAGELTSEIAVSGGGADPVAATHAISIDPAPATPGLETLDARVYEADGSAATRAGAHPFAVTTAFFTNTILNSNGNVEPASEIDDVEAKLPPGLIGNPQSTSRCRSHGELRECGWHQMEAQVGVSLTMLQAPRGEDIGGSPSPIWNLVPEAAVPAEFGFIVAAPQVRLRAAVRSDGDYGVTVSASETPQTREVVGSVVTFWGKPNEPIHDLERCSELYEGRFGGCQETTTPSTPFLTNPTDCVQQAWETPSLSMELSFWQSPTAFTAPWSSPIAPVSDCDRVPFHPSLRVLSSEHKAASPTALSTELHMPQVESQEGSAEADVRKAVVTLPEGMTISPAAAGGLSACSESQIGLTSSAPVRFDLAPPSCPESSKLGTAIVDTPLLEHPLTGEIYLAEQGNNPFGSLLALYLYVDDPADGVEVKVAGRVDPDPITGRVTATFDDLPQLAWGDVKLSFKPGPRAPIVTPITCGTFTATADLTPTSAAGTGPGGEAIPGGADAVSSDAIAVGGCAPPAFAPSFVAGTTNNQAGAFSPFTLTFSRPGDEEPLPSTIAVTMPPGVSGMLSNVPLCGEPQAAAGSCSAASQIGHVEVVFGDGPNPLTLPQPGAPQDPVYLTGPYEGAPFGLSIVVPAQAGPFDLGRVIVRAAVNVDQHTAQISVKSDPLPTILQGIPTDVRTVHVGIDRERFTFDPTSCRRTSVSGSIGASNGMVADVSSAYQAANCAGLRFRPGFKVSVTGRTSRATGAGLDAKLTFPSGSGQANIAGVKVSLPRKLPSRLTTLQKACPAKTFAANPASCPAGSRIGTAKAITPVLPVPLSGPVYFVSHGGAAFPDLVVVLQGYGVTVDLVGTTFISKANITSTTFKQVPDVPVSSFELKLPQGRNSALASNGNLCRGKLKMPTVFVGQNGARISKSTPIAVSGCRRSSTKARPKRR